MTTFAVATLGCKVNTYESVGYVEGLLALGYKEVSFHDVADVYIINTCAVTNTAASKSRQKIQRAKRKNPNAFICVVGCLMQTTPEEDYEVNLRVGSSGKKDLPQKIHQALQGEEIKQTLDDMRQIQVFESLRIHAFQKQTRAYLKIQDGCNQFCSYCIIPYARGKERSLPLEEAYQNAKELVESGHKEIVLTGIHTGRYGNDLGTNLLALLKRLVEIEGLDRIRISSIEMNEIDEAFIAFMKENTKIAKHLHIPIQSACNTTLQRMNRPYTVEKFIEKVNQICNEIPCISISSDIIMGFPQESEEEFLETMNNLETIQFSFLHVFPFSKRDGTKACTIEGHIINTIKKERCKKVSLLSKNLYNEYKSTFIGKEIEVLFEYEKDGYAFGHSSEYLPLQCKSDKAKINTIQKVIVTHIVDDTLYGE